MTVAQDLSPLLEPASIAFIGASPDAGRIGGMPIELMRHFGFQGQVWPVNPKYDEVFGWTCYPDIESVPGAPDLVVLAIAAPDVTAMLERCHAKGARSAIVYAAGFAEAGGEAARRGDELQRELVAFAQRTGMPVAGPNCLGFANLNLKAFTAFASIFKHVPHQSEPGRVSVLTQSGNVCSALFGLVREHGVPVTHFINTGNEACVEFSEYLLALAKDARTECVVGYVEQLRNGPRFVDAALEFAQQGKPLVLYKVGETEKGSEAAQSHTSAMAGNAAVYRAVFEQLNVIHAQDFAQIGDLAYLSGFRNRKAGMRAGIVSISGAMGAVLADKLIQERLLVPDLSADDRAALRAEIPDYGMVSNPVDVTGNLVNTPEKVKAVFELLARSPDLDFVVVNAPGYLLDRMTDALIDVCARHQRLFVAVDTGHAKRRAELAAGGVPVFDDLGRATRALGPFARWITRRDSGRVQQWGQLRAQAFAKASTRANASKANANATGASNAVVAADAAGVSDDAVQLPQRLNELEARQLLSSEGVPAPPGEAAVRDEDEAVRAANAIGYPVVLKVLSADIVHKTDVGGVLLNLRSEGDLRAACVRMLDAVQRLRPDARIDGLLVQPMATRGIVELIVGITRDPVHGLVMTVGLGGVLTEIYQDVVHRLLPVDARMATKMLRALRAWPLMDGYRGRPKADVAEAARAIEALSRVALLDPYRIAEIEVNPLQVFAEGDGVVALDAYVGLAKAQGVIGD